MRQSGCVILSAAAFQAERRISKRKKLEVELTGVSKSTVTRLPGDPLGRRRKLGTFEMTH